MSASVSNLAAAEAGEVPERAEGLKTPADHAQDVLDKTRRHPDAPSTVPLYLRALLELAVERERRETQPITITNNYA